MPKPVSEEELPAGKDLFDREYVEKLRAEAAGYRTKLKTFNEAFDGLNEEETDWMLDKVQAIASDPEAGSEGLLEIVQGFMEEDKLLDLLGVELSDGDEYEEEEDPEEEEEDEDVSTAEELRKLLEERDAAAAKAAEEADIEAAREEVYAEIEAAGFERGTPGFQHALAIGKVEASINGDVDFAALAPRIAAAAGIENFEPPAAEDANTNTEDGAAKKTAHPNTAGAGGNGAATENEADWLADAKEAGENPWDAARGRLEARLDNGSN